MFCKLSRIIKVCIVLILITLVIYNFKNGNPKYEQYHLGSQYHIKRQQSSRNVRGNRSSSHHIFTNIGHVACLNIDFQVNRSVSIMTMLTDSQNYVKGAVKLGFSVLSHVSIPVDLVIIELSNKPLSDGDKNQLQKVGWKMCTVERIKPRNEAGTYSRFRDQFTKLHVWNMTAYNLVLYLDSDALVVGNIDDLLSINLKTDAIGVTRDIVNGIWMKTFNMGVFIIHPNETECKRLVALKNNMHVTFDELMAEQGFLNVVYANSWLEIGFIYNANLAAYSQMREFWNVIAGTIRIIHYTMNKPWDCSKSYEAICKIWETADSRPK